MERRKTTSKKIKRKEEEFSWYKDIFPESNVLFKDILSILITYYILTFLIKIIQTIHGDYSQFAVSLVILWVVLSFIVYHGRKVNYNNLFKQK